MRQNTSIDTGARVSRYECIQTGIHTRAYNTHYQIMNAVHVQTRSSASDSGGGDPGGGPGSIGLP